MIRFEAEVLDIRLETSQPPRWQLLLTSTAFTHLAPTGHLEAVAPSGTRLHVPVLGVLLDQHPGLDGPDLWHIVSKPLAAGIAVTGTVDPPSIPEP